MRDVRWCIFKKLDNALAICPAATAGRKHQLRQHCAEMGAPVVGDGRYGCTRSPKQQRLRQLLQDTLAPEQDADEAELDRLLRCDSHLLLHCSRVCTVPCCCHSVKEPSSSVFAEEHMIHLLVPPPSKNPLMWW